jgi:L-fuconolactonase
MRIDAHQHYWKLERGDYDWMSAPAVASIRRDFLPDDLAPALQKHRIDRTIVVQAAATVAETDFLLEVAGQRRVGLPRGASGARAAVSPRSVDPLRA